MMGTEEMAIGIVSADEAISISDSPATTPPPLSVPVLAPTLEEPMDTMGKQEDEDPPGDSFASGTCRTVPPEFSTGFAMVCSKVVDDDEDDGLGFDCFITPGAGILLLLTRLSSPSDTDRRAAGSEKEKFIEGLLAPHSCTFPPTQCLSWLLFCGAANAMMYGGHCTYSADCGGVTAWHFSCFFAGGGL